MQYAGQVDIAPRNDDCAVVGIGASAGGLEAFSLLLKNLPSSLPVAVVFIQHLDPHHESGLVEILSGCTAMPVTQAEDGMAIESGRVYVIPPNALITIRGCRFFLSPREGDASRHLPIDHFFCSLAEDLKSQAIGMILSGGGSDGTIGLEAIKSEGGVTFAQDRSAKHESMPRQAISAGVVDFVLSPNKLAQELALLVQRLPAVETAVSTMFNNPAVLQQILTRVRESSGVDFTHYKSSTIQRRLARRLALRHLTSPEEYLEVLQQSEQETRDLFEDILITVTDFFRDPATFESLLEKAIPDLLRQHETSEPLRIWVAGCSTGKEAYSLAIVLTDAIRRMRTNHQIQLFGTDISERAVDAARQGRYPESIASRISAERLDRYFVRHDGGYQIARSIRDRCVFSRHDVTRDPPLARMDLISCRNLLIYLAPVLQRRVLSIFSYALKPGGCLVLGHSESTGTLSNHFKPLDAKQRIYTRNSDIPAPSIYDLPAPALRGANLFRPVAMPPHTTGLVDLDRAADRLLIEEYTPPGFLLNSELNVVKFHGDTGSYLTTASDSPGLNVFSLIRLDLVGALRTALDTAVNSGSIARELAPPDAEGEISIVVRPLIEPDQERHYLVLFERRSHIRRLESRGKTASAREASERSHNDLTLDLASTRAYMQRLVEELRSANEEAQSSNEELQSTNEELQTAKEELQSSNEELATTNEEMLSRNTELNQANSDLINLLSSLRLPILMLDRSLRIRRYTPVSQRLFRLIPGDVGRPISDLQPAFDLPQLPRLLRDVIDTGTAHEQEIRDTTGHWYSLRLEPYRPADNRIDGVVLQMVDIDVLRRSRDYAEAIVSTVHEALATLDAGFRIQKVNQSFCAEFEVRPSDVTGKSIYEILDARWNRPAVHELLEKVLSVESTPPDVEVEFSRPGGGYRTCLLNARLLGGEARQGILLAIEDITDRKRAAEAKYLRLFETAKDGILLTDGDGIVTDINPCALTMLRKTRAGTIGQSFLEVLSMSGDPASSNILGRLQSGEVVRLADVKLDSAEGTRIAEVVANTFDEDDHRRVIQFNIRDITERRHFDRKLQETAKLESLGLLAGGIAHDFNNLLTGIMGNASLALLDADGTPRYHSALRDVVKASHRAAELTAQMLAYAGKGRYVVRPIDLGQMVQDISGLVRMSIPKHVRIDTELQPGLPMIEGDASQLDQVVMNLIVNGAESIEDGRLGGVRVSTSLQPRFDPRSQHLRIAADDLKAGRFVVLTVSDNGSGMDETVLSSIFDPFFTTKFTGRGLGLAAVQGIVRGHGGALTVQSTPGVGTTVRVYFPASRQEQAETREEPEAPLESGAGTVMVVDDEQEIRTLAKSVLEMGGYRAVMAADGESAVRLALEQGSELSAILLDLTMPVMGGEQALAGIRETLPSLPVILSTGYDSSEIRARLNVAAVLQKPYTANELLRVLKQVVSKSGDGA